MVTDDTFVIELLHSLHYHQVLLSVKGTNSKQHVHEAAANRMFTNYMAVFAALPYIVKQTRNTKMSVIVLH